MGVVVAAPTVDVASPSPSSSSSSSSKNKRRRLWRSAWRWALPLALVTLTGALVYVRYEAKPKSAAPQYETMTIDRGPVAAKVTATGTVSALVTVLVGSQVSGRVDSIFVDFASPVKKGQTIATLEPSFFRASVAQARANLASARAGSERADAHRLQAESTYTRAKRLTQEGIASRAELEAAEADLAAKRADAKASVAAVTEANAALAQAELNLKYTTITSPIDGVVISRNVDVGQTVAATFAAPTMFAIAQDLTHMQVDTNVAEGDVGKIRSGMSVTFTVDAYPQQSFQGVVRQVRDNAQTIQNVVTYDAVIDVANPEHLLKPGMTASVTFNYASRAAVVRVANGALRFKPDAAMITRMTAAAGAAPTTTTTKSDERIVWILEDAAAAAGGAPSRATTALVKLGISDGALTEVIDGDALVGRKVVLEANGGGSK